MQFGIAVVTALLAAPVAAQALGFPGGMQRGAAEGNAVGGPVGGVVGGVLGGVAGGVGGFLGADQRPAFHDFVMREGRSCAEPVQPGLILPREESSITACLPNMV